MVTVLRRLRTLIVKEILILLRDPKGRTILVVPPIIQLLLFAYAVTLEVKNVSVIILNQDPGIHSRELSARIASSNYFSSVTFTTDPMGLKEPLDRQEVLLALHFPQDFSSAIDSGKGSTLQILADGRRSNAVQVVTSYLGEIINDYIFELTGMPDGGIEISGRHWFNPGLDFSWTIIPSLMAIITMIMTLNISAMSLAREKELGTFEQLLVTPYTPVEIIIGKLIPAISLAVFESMLIYILGRLLFGVPMCGSFALLIASVVLFSFSIIGFGFFVSSIVKNQQQAIVGVFMFMVPSVALSGFAAPVENMPDWLQQAVIMNPLKHTLIILNGVFLKAMPANEVWQNAWPLPVIGIMALAISGWMFRRNIG
jgi:ABC-2 type transport system permease protein